MYVRLWIYVKSLSSDLARKKIRKMNQDGIKKEESRPAIRLWDGVHFPRSNHIMQYHHHQAIRWSREKELLNGGVHGARTLLEKHKRHIISNLDGREGRFFLDIRMMLKTAISTQPRRSQSVYVNGNQPPEKLGSVTQHSWGPLLERQDHHGKARMICATHRYVQSIIISTSRMVLIVIWLAACGKNDWP